MIMFILLRKRHIHGLGDKIVNWVENWLENWKQRVLIVLSGVPLGSDLGAIICFV